MSNEVQTLEASDPLAAATGDVARVYLIVAGEPGRRSRVLDLAPGQAVTVGRASGATLAIDHHQVSRLHARIWRDAEVVRVEDLGSRNGTSVNGERLTAARRLALGDEIAIGPLSIVVGWVSRLTRTAAPVELAEVEERLAAELDRARRYRRSLAVLAVRVAGDDAVGEVVRRTRRMDLVGELGGDDLVIVAPELGLDEVRREGARLVAGLPGAQVGCAVLGPEVDSADALVAAARVALVGAAVPTASVAGVVVVDPAMRRLYQLVDKIADTEMTVLILGETGVGKEAVAEAIHARSARRRGPLVRVNSASIPSALIESELFGHERGAFTGADRRKVGYLEAAAGGTLLLDELGELPAAAQAKLLRAIERKAIVRVGATDEVPVDVRIVAATHRDLEADASAGRFREDLYFRIAQFTLVVPPLRDRPGEIIPLAEHFLGGTVLTAEAAAALAAYDWPGNVRELRNAMVRAAVMAGGGPVTLDALPERIVDAGRRRGAVGPGVKGAVADFERQAIVAALEAEGGNQSRAARRLGLSRRGFIYKLEKHGLKPPPPSADQRRPAGGGS